MKLAEVIERLTPYAEGEKTSTEREDMDAFQIAIAAVRAIELCRKGVSAMVYGLLDGETRD